MVLETVLRFISYLRPRSDDDWVDQLHNFLTSNICLALSMLVSFKQFGGKPIECMLPKMFPGSWEDYAENYCFAQNTFFLPWHIDLERKTPRDRMISYYQWVPFFLLIEAVFFRLPSLIWKYLAAHSGIRIHDIVRVAVDEHNIQPDVKQNNLNALTNHLQNALRFHRRLHRKHIRPHKLFPILNLPYSAVYVTFTYMITKIIYLINVWAQLLLMNRFLQTDKYTWFWYMVLMILTTISFSYWLFIMLPWPSRWFISRHLELSEMPFDSKGSAKDVERFVSGYLKTDGVFVLRMITMHSGIIFGTDLVLRLWRSFYGIEEKIKRVGGATQQQQDQPALTPSPTDVTNALRQRRLNQDQKAMRGQSGKSESSKQEDDNNNKKKTASLVEAASKAKKPGVVLVPTSPPSVAIAMPASTSSTLEASKRQPKKPALKLVMPVDSDDESESDDVSIQQGDVEKGVPLLPRSRAETTQRTSL